MGCKAKNQTKKYDRNYSFNHFYTEWVCHKFSRKIFCNVFWKQNILHVSVLAQC